MKSKKQENNENKGNEIKIKDLVAKIKRDFKKLKVVQKSSTELKLKIADRFVRLQILVREEGYQWLPFVKKAF